MSAIDDATPQLAHDRNAELDFIKGVLVLFMVLYHWFGYFVGPQAGIYIYLRFLTPSFIFISGFLIAHVYPSRYQRASRSASRRLAVRGLKILALFTGLNLCLVMLFSAGGNGFRPSLIAYAHQIPSIYLSGNANTAFSVLVPISYLLLMAAMMVSLARGIRSPALVACVVLFALTALGDALGRNSATLTLLAIGSLGLVVGTIPFEQLHGMVARPYRLVALYALYVLWISSNGVGYVLQTIGVCLTLPLIYWVALRSRQWAGFQYGMARLGTYSLFAYIAQIALLQALKLALSQMALSTATLNAGSLVLAFVMTFAAVDVVHRARRRSQALDKAYRLAFT